MDTDFLMQFYNLVVTFKYFTVCVTDTVFAQSPVVKALLYFCQF